MWRLFVEQPRMHRVFTKLSFCMSEFKSGLCSNYLISAGTFSPFPQHSSQWPLVVHRRCHWPTGRYRPGGEIIYALHCTALYCTVLHCTSLSTVLHCTAMYFSENLSTLQLSHHFTVPHCTCTDSSLPKTAAAKSIPLVHSSHVQSPGVILPHTALNKDDPTK